LSRTKDCPFILKWEEDQKDPHQKGTEDKLTADVNKEPKLKVTRPSQRHEEIQDQIGKPLPTTATDKNRAPLRTSNRIKKSPTTMNEDFLWVTGSLTRVHQQPV
jgi:hypothetical protein